MPTRTKAGWEAAFDRWAVGPAATEATKCENAERMVRDAIRAYPPLAGRNVDIFAQGSYRNRTNVRGDSDVDVGVLSKVTFFPNFEHVPGTTLTSLGVPGATYGFADLKNDVEQALVAKFGRREVTAGSKAFDIKDNTYRVSADVVPTFVGRLYRPNAYGPLIEVDGTVLQDGNTGKLIFNYPEQHYANGVTRHTETGRQFKKKARILKNLANEMAEEGFESAQKMSSFLLESIAYNGENAFLTQTDHYEAIEGLLLLAWDKTQTADKAKDMMEVNGIKYLFHANQPWRREDVHRFMSDALSHVGYIL